MKGQLKRHKKIISYIKKLSNWRQKKKLIGHKFLYWHIYRYITLLIDALNLKGQS